MIRVIKFRKSFLLMLSMLMLIAGLSIPKISPFCFFAFCLIILSQSKKYTINTESIILILFLLTMLVIGTFNDLYNFEMRTLFISLILPVFAFQAGRSFLLTIHEFTSYNAMLIMIVFSFGLMCFCGLSLSIGFEQSDITEIIFRRTIRNYWVQDPNVENYKIGVAMVGMFTNLLVGLVPLLIFQKSLNFTWKYRTLFCFIFGGVVILVLFIDVVLSNRTPFILLVVNVILTFFFLSKNEQFKTVFKSLLKYSIVLLVISVIIWYKFDLYEIFFGLSHRFEQGIKTGRYDYWLYGISILPYYPLGGIKLEGIFDIRSFHNFWFDLLRIGGWIPLLLGIVFSLKQWNHFSSMLRNRKIPSNIRVFFLCTGTSIWFAYFAEPVIQGSTEYFAYTFFYFGFISVFVKKYNDC